MGHWRSMVLGGLTGLLTCAGEARSQTQLLPDLQVLSSYLSGWSVVNTGGSGREIRLSTGVANGGQGPLHLYTTANTITSPDGTQSQEVRQRISWSNGTFTDRLVGYFVYHPTDGHFLVEGWTKHRLRLRPLDNSVGGVVAEAEQTAFCTLDLNHYNAALPGSPASAVYSSCNALVQGVSVGWNNVEGSGLAGQAINITGVPSGNYWLEDEVDPRGNILESSETNNVTRISITLSGLPTVGLMVLSSTPSGSTNGPASSVDFAFNQAIDPTTFTLADVSFTGPSGPIAATSISPVSGTTAYRVGFASQTVPGTYTMTIGPNIVSAGGQTLDQNNNGIGGEAGDAYTGVFSVARLRVIGHIPTATQLAPVSAIDVTFNKPIDPVTFTTADIVSFSHGFGPIAVTSVSLVGGNTYRVSFPVQSNPGLYTMVIGPNINDTAGFAMDQDGNGVSGEISDRYTALFTIGTPGVVGPSSYGYWAYPLAADPLPSIATGGASLAFADTDDGSAAINLGANNFNFYGTTYSGAASLFASTNALLTFGSANADYQNADLGYSPPQAAIAVLWDDWLMGSGSPQVRYKFIDTNGDAANDWLIIEWNQIKHYPSSSTGLATFRAALRVNTGATAGDIILAYADTDVGSADSFGSSATVGIKAASGYTALQWSNNQPVIANGTVILISLTPPAGACCINAACSMTAANACPGVFQGFNAACGSPGNPTTCCPANFNGVGGVTVADIFAFLSAWFANDPSANFNGVGGITVADIFAYLSAWFAGCS